MAEDLNDHLGCPVHMNLMTAYCTSWGSTEDAVTNCRLKGGPGGGTLGKSLRMFESTVKQVQKELRVQHPGTIARKVTLIEAMEVLGPAFREALSRTNNIKVRLSTSG